MPEAEPTGEPREYSTEKLTPELKETLEQVGELVQFLAEDYPGKEFQLIHFSSVRERALALAEGEPETTNTKVLALAAELHDIGKFPRTANFVSFALLNPEFLSENREIRETYERAFVKEIVSAVDENKLVELDQLSKGERYLLIRGLEKGGLHQLISHHLISYLATDIIFHPEKYNSGAPDTLKGLYTSKGGGAEVFDRLGDLPEDEKEKILTCILEHQIRFFMEDKAKELGYPPAAIEAIRRQPTTPESKIFQDADKLDMTTVWGSVAKIVNDHQTQKWFFPKGSDKPEPVWASFQSAKKSAGKVGEELTTEGGKKLYGVLEKRLQYFEEKLKQEMAVKALIDGNFTIDDFNRLVDETKVLMSGDLKI